MLQLTRIHGENVLFFNDPFSLPVNPGVTYLGGRDSSVSAESSNGTGKSTVASIIPQIFFGAKPVKGLTSINKGGYLAARMVVDDQTYDFINRARGNHVSLEVLKFDSPDIYRSVHGKKRDTENLILELTNFSQDSFYTCSYLDAWRPSPFLFGKDTDRVALMSKLFLFDRVYNIFDDTKRRLKDAKQVNEEAIRVKDALSLYEDDEVYQKKIALLKKKVLSTSNEIDKLISMIEKASASDLDFIRRQVAIIELSKSEFATLERDIKRVTRSLDRHKKTQELQDSIYELEAQKGIFIDDRADIRNDLPDSEDISIGDITFSFKGKYKLRDLEEIADRLEATRPKVKEAKRYAKTISGLHKQASSLREGFTSFGKDVATLHKALYKTYDLLRPISSQANRLMLALKNILEIDVDEELDTFISYVNELTFITKETIAWCKADLTTSVRRDEDAHSDILDGCPTCGAQVSLASLEERKSAKAVLYKTIKSVIDDVDAYANIVHQVDDYIACKRDINRQTKAMVAAKLDKLEAVDIGKVDLLASYIDKSIDIRKLTIQISSLKKECNQDHILDDDALAEANATLKRLTKAQRNLTTYESFYDRFESVASANKFIASSGDSLESDKYREMLREKSKEKDKLLVELSELEKELEAKREIELEFEKHKWSILEYEAVSMVRKITDPRLVITDLLSSLSERLSDNLNSLASEFFTSPIEFEVKVSDKDFMIFCCQRNRNFYPVSNLSTGEKKSFSALLACALSPMIPANFRTDFIILDELEANTDSIRREHLLTNGLAVLKSTFDKVLWVSPKTPEELGVDFDALYYTILEDGAAHIVEG